MLLGELLQFSFAANFYSSTWRTNVNFLRKDIGRSSISIEMYVLLKYFLFLVLGESACAYWGAIDKYCQKNPVPVNELPKECTSYVFEALSVNTNFTVTTKFSEADEGN